MTGRGAAWAILFACLLAAPVHACVCKGIPTSGLDGIGRSYAVFEGVAIGKRVAIDNYSGRFFPTNEITFAVTQVWKGNHVSRIRMLESGSDCGMHFSAGKRYLVFADGYDPLPDRLSASVCSATGRLPDTMSADELRRTMGTPVATFAVPARGELPGHVAEIWYHIAGRFVAGVALVMNVIAQGRGVTELYYRNEPFIALGIGAGVVALLVLCALLLLLRRRKRVAGVLLAVALVVSVLAVFTAGHFYTLHTANWWSLQWVLAEGPNGD